MIHLKKQSKRVRSDVLWWKTLLPVFNEVLFFDDKSRRSYIVKRLIYAGLIPGTRSGYQAAIKSLHGKWPWPAIVAPFGRMGGHGANRIMGSTPERQGQIKPETLGTLLISASLLSYGTRAGNWSFPIASPETTLRGGKSFLRLSKLSVFLSPKRSYPKSQQKPQSIQTRSALTPRTRWLGRALTASFQDLQLTGSDVSFCEFDQYVTLRLKRNSGVLIIIAVWADVPRGSTTKAL